MERVKEGKEGRRESQGLACTRTGLIRRACVELGIVAATRVRLHGTRRNPNELCFGFIS